MSGFLLLSDDILYHIGSFLPEAVLHHARLFHDKNNRERRWACGERYRTFKNSVLSTTFIEATPPPAIPKRHQAIVIME